MTIKQAQAQAANQKKKTHQLEMCIKPDAEKAKKRKQRDKAVRVNWVDCVIDRNQLAMTECVVVCVFPQEGVVASKEFYMRTIGKLFVCPVIRKQPESPGRSSLSKSFYEAEITQSERFLCTKPQSDSCNKHPAKNKQTPMLISAL